MKNDTNQKVWWLWSPEDMREELTNSRIRTYTGNRAFFVRWKFLFPLSVDSNLHKVVQYLLQLLVIMTTRNRNKPVLVVCIVPVFVIVMVISEIKTKQGDKEDIILLTNTIIWYIIRTIRNSASNDGKVIPKTKPLMQYPPNTDIGEHKKRKIRMKKI